MATQNRTTKPQPTQGSAAARQAAQAPAADAAKMAKQAADKAELDKMAQAKQAEAVKEVVAETTAEGSVATADAAAAAEGSLGAVSGEAAVAEAGAAGAAGTAAAISPLAIGAGVVGVVAVAAAAGGGSSGGSSSQPIAQNNNQQAAQNQGSQKPATPAAEQPAQDTKPAEGTNKPAEGAKPTEPAKEEEPAKQADSKPADQPKVDPTPVEDLTKPATAAGTAAEPKVAADGVTNLTKFADLFETAGANGGKAEYIKISRILSAENAKDAEARAVDSDNSRAYEVIDAGKPITLAEAQTMAAKLGGKLMSIDTAEEKAWLDKNLFGALGEYDGDKSLAEAAARGESDKAAQQKVLDGQLASNGAWLGKNATEGADAKANAVIRNGNNADGSGAMKLYEAAGTTLSKFVIEYEGYKSPLLLDGKPVVEGQIINKADAAKLAWNADLNKAGKITYQAVDSNDAATAKPVADAKEGTMALSESADVKHPMTTPANPSAQDKPAQGGTEVKPANDVPQADKTGQDTQNSDQQPAKQELPATAQGTAEAPQVAANGETKLANVATAFEKAAGEGKNVEFIKIVHVDTSEGEAGTRIFRNVETTSKATSKAPDAPAPVKTVSTTAYEVIDAGKPISRAEAEEMAKARGGKLLTIDSADEAKFIGENLFGTLGAYDSDESVAEAQGDTAKAAQQEVLNGQLSKNGAWLGKDSTAGAVANADAIIRNGNGTDLPKGYKAYDFTGEKLSRFVIEIENYKAPLTLEGKPVVDGQIINKADFDKLVWNGDHNMGGKITYVAVQSNEANAAKVEGAEEKTLTVSESATITHPSAPASNPAQNQQQGGAGTPEVQDSKAPAGGEGPKGDQKAGEGSNKAGDPPKGGEHGTDGGNHKADTPQNSTTGSDANKGNTNPGSQGAAAGGSTGGAGAQGGSKPQEGGSDSKAGGTTQDAGSQSQGQTPPSKPAGTPEGQPAGTPVQSGGQAVNPSEGSTQNGEQQPAQPKLPTYPDSQKLDVATHDAPSTAIKADLFLGTGENKAAAVKITEVPEGALKKGADAVNANDVIQAADFGNLTWDATKAEGGAIKFKPVTADGNEIADAKVVTINVNEPSAPAPVKEAPSYEPNKSVNVAHDDANAKIGKEVFEGTNPANKPEAVKATGFAAGTLKVNGVAIADGDKIAAENFDKVTWDASKGDGGSFKFKPVSADGNEIADAKEQSITINEAPAAPAPNKVAYAGHDVKKAEIGSKVFEGSDGQKPEAVKISGVTADTLKKGGVSVTEGQLIKAEDFDKLTWDSTKGDGGSFKFTPVKANGDAIEGATEKTVDIKEAADSTAVEVGRDAAPLTLDKSIFGDADAVQILTVRGPVAEDRTNANVLTYTPEGGQKTALTDGAYLDKANFEKVQWDAQADANNAGTYRVLFKPVTAGHEEIPGAEPKEIKVHEATGDLDYSTSPKTVNVETHDGTQMIPEAVFKGTGATPLYVWFKESTETNPTGSDRTFLKLAEGSSEPGKDLSHDAVISIGDLGKVQWDAAHNDGGTIRFQALDGDQNPIGDWHTITVIDPQQALGAADVLNPQGAGAQLKSLATYTPAEPSSNLLDDLHNQISPLI